MHDIIVYSNDQASLDKFVSEYPHAKTVKASSINKRVLKKFKQTLTSHCYIIKPEKKHFIGFEPESWNVHSPHVLGDQNNLLLPNHSKYNGALHGEVVIVDSNFNSTIQEITDDEVPNIIPLDSVLTVSFGEGGLVEKDKICFQSIGDPMVWQILKDFDFEWFNFIHHKTELTKSFELPRALDANKVHVWDNDPHYFWVHKSLLDFEKDNPLIGTKFTSADTPIVRNNPTENFGVKVAEHSSIIVDELPKRKYWEWGNKLSYQEVNSKGTVIGYDGVTVSDPRYPDQKKVFVPYKASQIKDFDIFFLSNNEEYADEHYELLLQRYPNTKRVDGVQGIAAAHKTCANMSTTPYFWVVDADAELLPSFSLDFCPPRAEWGKVYVFRSRNPVNGLIYGNGGVKLLPTKGVLNAPDTNVDFTTSIGPFVPVATLSNMNNFNKTPYEAWKGAFREAAKLTSGVIKNANARETSARLKAWMEKGKEKENGEYCLIGAQMGHEFALNSNNDIHKINDTNWLKEQYKCIQQKKQSDSRNGKT